MHPPLQLRKNSDVISQQAKRLVKFVLANYKKGSNNYMGEEKLHPAGFSGIKYLTSEERVVIDHGWAFYPILLKLGIGYEGLGKTLEGLFRSRSNGQNWNRHIFIKSKATKGQRLIAIEIKLEGTYEENYLLVNEAGKIIPCQFAAMQSHNWDEDSTEALALIKKPEPADVYDWDQDDDPDRGMEVHADEY